MKRTLVFLLLGSTLVYCVAWTVYMPPGTGLGKLTDPIFGFYAVMLFVLSLLYRRLPDWLMDIWLELSRLG